MVKDVNIYNFKSIKNISFEGKRINLFIGKPNVGKSNILEAISLFSFRDRSSIRLENQRNLFFDQNVKEPIVMVLDDLFYFQNFDSKQNVFDTSIVKGEHENFQKIKDYEAIKNYFENVMNVVNFDESPDFYFPKINFGSEHLLNGDRDRSSSSGDKFPIDIKQYIFKKDLDNSKTREGDIILAHPYGENLFSLLKDNRELLAEVSDLFKEYGYSLVIDFVSNQAEIQKTVGNVSYKIPYSLVADTLQRIIFYLAAIKTNKNAVILLEEPENHSFPPYIKRLADEIIASTENQFFIATHSPYLLNTIISDSPEGDVAVHIVSYSDYQTKIKTLSKKELSEILDYGIDVFFNLNLFE